MKDVMIDLETLSTRSNAAIISIGARMFDRTTWELGPSLYERCDPGQAKGSYHIDTGTIRWWLQQNEAARLELAKDTPSLTDVMHAAQDAFAKWAPEYVWAIAPTFDLTILEHALRAEGLVVPWKYNAPRCVRTVCDMAGLAKEDRVKPVVAHNALADCDAQIATLRVAFERLGAA